MKKGLLYILINFLSVVIAEWITVEHDFKMCDQVIPSKLAAFHIDDDGINYSTSLLVRELQTINHEPPLTTVNITMWGCTYDCNFSFMVKINRDDLTVSSFTEKNLNNYKCNLSNYTIKLIPTPKITYKQKSPNPDHVFPTDLTAQYCSEGKHPDLPELVINKTEHVAECIDFLTGHEVGSYAASLQFGTGSSLSADGYNVATYHMINSANKLFNYWERHHRGFHEALSELSNKMTSDNLKELIPPPPPPPKHNFIKFIIISVAVSIAILGVYFGGTFLGELVGGVLGAEIVEATTFAAQLAAAFDAIAFTVVGTIEFINATSWEKASVENPKNLEKFKNVKGDCSNNITSCESSAMSEMSTYYQKSGNPNIQQIIASLSKASDSPIEKRDTGDTRVMDNVGFFTVNMVNSYFLPSLMDNVHQSFTGQGQTYTDISSYLAAASENLQFHFEDTLHNNFFAANKSILASFTIHQKMDSYNLLDNDDDVYNTIKTNTYNHMAASIISVALQKVNVEICDPKPSFCGQSCACPTIGDDNCIINASDGQIKELKFLRDTFDICSTNTTKTGWNITHNPNCKIKKFHCQ